MFVTAPEPAWSERCFAVRLYVYSDGWNDSKITAETCGDKLTSRLEERVENGIKSSDRLDRKKNRIHCFAVAAVAAAAAPALHRWLLDISSGTQSESRTVTLSDTKRRRKEPTETSRSD